MIGIDPPLYTLRFSLIASHLSRTAAGASLLVHQGSHKCLGLVEATEL